MVDKIREEVEMDSVLNLSLPVLTYGLIVGFVVAGTVSYPPAAYECPV
jgi:hypothetical protein